MTIHRELLNSSTVNVSDVLLKRRKQIGTRLGIWALLMVACVPTLGWAWTMAYAATYFLL
jgi:hypothetical protein